MKKAKHKREFILSQNPQFQFHHEKNIRLIQTERQSTKYLTGTPQNYHNHRKQENVTWPEDPGTEIIRGKTGERLIRSIVK